MIYNSKRLYCQCVEEAMGYKIIMDSCGELPQSLKNDERFERVPLGLEVGEYHIWDDESFDQKDFLQRLAAYPGCAKSSCPSPERFMKACQVEAENIYIITISSHLSGSYNSALLAKQLYLEKDSDKNICVIDSHSASGGETQIGLLAMDLEEKGLPFEEIEKRLFAYRDKLRTFFVLDNLETLRKNGRLSAVKSMVAQTLSIKPIMGEKEGVILQRSQAIGIKKALSKMIDTMYQEIGDLVERRIVITHCNCPERVDFVISLLKAKFTPKEIIVMPTAGLSTLYANDGGIIIAA